VRKSINSAIHPAVSWRQKLLPRCLSTNVPKTLLLARPSVFSHGVFADVFPFLALVNGPSTQRPYSCELLTDEMSTIEPYNDKPDSSSSTFLVAQFTVHIWTHFQLMPAQSFGRSVTSHALSICSREISPTSTPSSMRDTGQ